MTIRIGWLHILVAASCAIVYHLWRMTEAANNLDDAEEHIAYIEEELSVCRKELNHATSLLQRPAEGQWISYKRSETKGVPESQT